MPVTLSLKFSGEFIVTKVGLNFGGSDALKCIEKHSVLNTTIQFFEVGAFSASRPPQILNSEKGFLDYYYFFYNIKKQQLS